MIRAKRKMFYRKLDDREISGTTLNRNASH
jgi:hypothetical protein